MHLCFGFQGFRGWNPQRGTSKDHDNRRKSGKDLPNHPSVPCAWLITTQNSKHHTTPTIPSPYCNQAVHPWHGLILRLHFAGNMAGGIVICRLSRAKIVKDRKIRRISQKVHAKTSKWSETVAPDQRFGGRFLKLTFVSEGDSRIWRFSCESNRFGPIKVQNPPKPPNNPLKISPDPWTTCVLAMFVGFVSTVWDGSCATPTTKAPAHRVVAHPHMDQTQQ